MAGFKETLTVMQQRMIASISRSAVMILSSSFNTRLASYFTASELVLVLGCMHALLNTIRTVPGFGASWRMLRDMVQFAVVHALAEYVSGRREGGRLESAHQTAVLNLILVLVILEAVPGAIHKGWIHDDAESFTSSVSYIFADHISTLLARLGIPLAGAGLALCLGGQKSTDPLLYRTLAFVGINTLSSLAFDAISGGELSLIWPLTLLYFIHELSQKFDVETFFSYGLYNASDAVYASLSARGVSPSTTAIGFVFLGASFPADPVWTGVCVLVFVQGVSNWFMQQVAFVASTDPVLAGLGVVTAVHFVSLVVERSSAKQ
jgi:hypothetical protein